MRLIHFSCVLGMVLVGFAACDNKPKLVETKVEEPVSATKTFETTALEQAMAAYRANPTEQNKAAVDKAFAELDGEIAELKQKAASESGDQKVEAERKLANLETYRERQRGNYAGERVEAAAESAGNAVEGAAKDVGRAIERTGEAIREAVE